MNEDQWEHHFESENYRLVSDLSRNEFERSVREKNFIKIVSKIPLQQWEVAEEKLLGYFEEIIALLAH